MVVGQRESAQTEDAKVLRWRGARASSPGGGRDGGASDGAAGRAGARVLRQEERVPARRTIDTSNQHPGADVTSSNRTVPSRTSESQKQPTR